METSKPKPKRGTLRQNLFDKVIYSYQFWIFFVLTIAIILTGGVFHVPGIVEHPQFDEYTDPDFLKSLMDKNLWLKLSYYGFFILDFFWAFFLLLMLWKFVHKQMSEHSKSYPKYVLRGFTSLIFLAYIFDILENLTYLIYMEYSSFLVGAKLLFYVLVGIIFVFIFIRDFSGKLVPIFLNFLVSSTYSLLILLIIGVFLPTASQVNSIVVDLYLKPWNLLILLLLIAPFFAIVIAHYPCYFNINENFRKWYMAKNIRFILGIVHYRYKKDYESSPEGKLEGNVNFLFRILGICFYAALFYMIAYTSEINFDWMLQSSKISFALLLIGVLLMYLLKETKDDWYESTYNYLADKLPNFYDGDYTPYDEKLIKKKSAKLILDKKKKKSEQESTVESESALKTINTPVKYYVGLLGLTILAHLALGVLLYFCETCRYSEITVILSLLCIVLQTILFIFYRVFRSVFRFTFFNAKLESITTTCINKPYGKSEKDYTKKEKEKLKMDKEKVITFFKENNFSVDNKVFQFMSILRFGTLSNNVNFLRNNAIFGAVNALFLLVINYNSDLAIAVSSILIILSALYLFYGILVVLTKSYIYYKYSEEPYKRNKSIYFKYLCIGLVIVLLLANALTKKFENNLFTLFPLERMVTKEQSLKTYVASLATDRTRYYIGCYGGGMKSNAWTLTVLNELYNKDTTFFSKAVGISGVSGGTMGLVNMSSIIKYNPLDDNRRNPSWNTLIRDISTANILSLDLVHMLGRDTFGYLFVPGYDLSESDRSSRAMARYAYLANNRNAITEKRSYRNYWKELYDSWNKAYPILISNTTNVRGNQGMAVSVKVEDTYAKSLLYQGADDILEINGQSSNNKKQNSKDLTLGYYDAASTSNRFPLISPAAKIESKGHYNDGGIYENSGLLSVFKLFKAVSFLDTIRRYDALKQKNVFISIVNDKNLYIRRVLRDARCTPTKINRHSELSAIVSSVASTEMMPIFIKKELEQHAKDFSHKIAFETIYLPHRFTVEDIKSVMGKELACRQNMGAIDAFLYNIVRKNNKQIENLLKVEYSWGSKPIIEPPMSRVMAAPAYEFMVQMLEHPIPKNALKRIKEHGN